MRLYSWSVSPFARKARMMLRYKEIPFDAVPASPATQREAKKLAGSPKVPVLVDACVAYDEKEKRSA